MPKRVLMCDDEIHILRAAEIKLNAAGYEVRIARDGQEAWEAIERDPPDLVVTDVQMPRVDGLELCRRIRNHPATKDLPILMLTAKGFELTEPETVETWGISAIIAKPFSPRELARSIDQILAGSPASL